MTQTSSYSYTVPGASSMMDPATLYGNVEQQLQGYGNAQLADAKQNYLNSLGVNAQQMASSGLAGTTIAPSMRMGFSKQYQLALNNLNQSLTQTQLGAQSTFGLGGIQAQQAGQQIGNQMALGMGNLALGYGQLGVQQQNANNQTGAQNAGSDAAIYANQANINNANVAGGGNVYPGGYA
jgi:hypothetical protein